MATPVIEFEEVELPRTYAATATGGETFQTSIIGNRHNIHQRNVGRELAVRQWVLDFGQLATVNNPNSLNELREFFYTKYGQGIGWRFYAPRDHAFVMDEIGTGDGAENEFLLKRTYTGGGVTITRRIVKPCDVDLDIYFDDDLQAFTRNTDYTIDTVNGKITFAVAPANGKDIFIDGGEYCIPAVFDTDQFFPELTSTYAEWPGIGIVELLPANVGITA